MTSNLFFDLAGLGRLGRDAIVGRAVRIRRPACVRLGDGCIIDDFVYISCELEMGHYCHIASNVVLSGGSGRVLLGNFVGIGPGCSVHAASAGYLEATLDLPSVPAAYRFGGSVSEVRMGDHVSLGAHSTILPGVILPEGFACAAHTVVRKKEYEPWTLYGGYECKRLMRRRSGAARLQGERLLAGLPPATAEELAAADRRPAK